MSLTSLATLRISSRACWSAVISMVSRMMSSKYKSTVSWWTLTTYQTHTHTRDTIRLGRTFSIRRTSRKIWSSSLRRRSSACLLPLSSASRLRRSRSASSVKAWMRRSSCRRISSLERVSNTYSSSAPTAAA